MTFFEELCKDLGAGPNSGAEEIICELVNEMIFDKDRSYTDEEIYDTVKKRFNKEHC